MFEAASGVQGQRRARGCARMQVDKMDVFAKLKESEVDETCLKKTLK